MIFGKGKVVYNPQLEEGEPYYSKRKANKGDKPNNHKLGVISESETTDDSELNDIVKCLIFNDELDTE